LIVETSLPERVQVRADDAFIIYEVISGLASSTDCGTSTNITVWWASCASIIRNEIWSCTSQTIRISITSQALSMDGGTGWASGIACQKIISWVASNSDSTTRTGIPSSIITGTKSTGIIKREIGWSTSKMNCTTITC